MPVLSQPKPCLLVMLLLLSAFLCLQLQAQDQEEPPLTYRRTIAEVRLTFLATQNQTTRLASLQPGDFVVVDSDAIVRDFHTFTRAPEMKLDLLILLDYSESVSAQVERELREVMHLVTDSRSIDENHLSMVGFSGTQPKILCAADCRAWVADSRLSPASGAGATPLFDAVVFASAILGEKPDPDVRHVLVIFSDGVDTISRYSGSEAIAAALKAEAQIYTVDIAGRKNHTSQGIDTLKQMANLTGGAYFGASDNAAQILESMLADLRSSYVVTYRVPNLRPGFHDIRILPTHNLNLEFRSRRGYYYGDGR